jgi:hypothetical protein
MQLYTNGYRGPLVGGAILLWGFALIGGFQRNAIATTARPATATPVSASRDHDAQTSPAQVGEFEAVTELVIVSSKRRAAKPKPAPVVSVPTALVSSATYPVWFESERELGKCKINWEGGSMTANLHASARLPEGKVAFSYVCGDRRGRGSIKVEPTRVNGVLFCEDAGGVRVDTVRRDDGRCEHSSS